MGAIKINHNLKASLKIEELMKTFTPRFGNNNDINIVKEYGDIKKILSLWERRELRREELKEITRNNQAEKKTIAKKEKRILWLFKQRLIHRK